LIDFVGKNEQNERVSTLLWAKGLRWLRWLKTLKIVKMVAGLPRLQINDQELLRAN
jgi:hypothetical protein